MPGEILFTVSAKTTAAFVRKKTRESKRGDKSFGKDTFPWEAVGEVLQGSRGERIIRKQRDRGRTTGKALEDANPFLGT